MQKQWKNNENWWTTLQKQWKTNEIWWTTMQKQWNNNENWWKTLQKQWKTNEIWWKTMQKQWKNNENWWKTLQKQWKTNEIWWKTMQKQWTNNEKVWLEDFDPGSRTSTRTSRFSANARALAERLARGLRPIHPGYYNGETQRGNKKGTQREKNGKTKNKKNHIYKF